MLHKILFDIDSLNLMIKLMYELQTKVICDFIVSRPDGAIFKHKFSYKSCRNTFQQFGLF